MRTKTNRRILTVFSRQVAVRRKVLSVLLCTAFLMVTFVPVAATFGDINSASATEDGNCDAGTVINETVVEEPVLEAPMVAESVVLEELPAEEPLEPVDDIKNDVILSDSEESFPDDADSSYWHTIENNDDLLPDETDVDISSIEGIAPMYDEIEEPYNLYPWFDVTENPDNPGTGTISWNKFYRNPPRDLVIPSEINGIIITHIADNAFQNGTRPVIFPPLTSLVIPDSVVYIGDNAFCWNNITGLMIIPDSVTYIGDDAFIGNKITDLVIGNSVTHIGTYAFPFNNLTRLILPDSVTHIGFGAFNACGLTEVVLPKFITQINGGVFSSNNLTSINIPDSVTYIGDDSFSHNFLTSLIIPETVKHIGFAAFGSNRLTDVSIPDSITRIEPHAFSENNLTSIKIPDTVTYIGYGAFGSNKLTSVVIPELVTFIGAYAFGYNSLTEIVIPDLVTHVENGAFESNKLTNAIIGASVEFIGDYAFGSNRLTSVVIPDTVTHIGYSAFRLNELKNVIIGSSIEYIGYDTFGYNPDLTDITVMRCIENIPDDLLEYAPWEAPDEVMPHFVCPDGSLSYTVAPTCFNTGEWERRCDTCEDFQGRGIAATLGGHSMGSWFVVTSPTVTVEGQERQNCVRMGCEHFETRVIAVLGTGTQEGGSGNGDGGSGSGDTGSSNGGGSNNGNTGGSSNGSGTGQGGGNGSGDQGGTTPPVTTPTVPTSPAVPTLPEVLTPPAATTPVATTPTVTTPVVTAPAPAAATAAVDTEDDTDESEEPVMAATSGTTGTGAAADTTGAGTALDEALPQSFTESTIEANELLQNVSEEFKISDIVTPLGTISLGGRDIIVFSPVSHPSWSLVNLILTVLGVTLVLLTGARAFIQKRRVNKEMAGTEIVEDTLKHRVWWFATAAVAAIGMTIMFAITQDFRTDMVLMDWYTLVFTAAFALTLVSGGLVFKRKVQIAEVYA